MSCQQLLSLFWSVICPMRGHLAPGASCMQLGCLRRCTLHGLDVLYMHTSTVCWKLRQVGWGPVTRGKEQVCVCPLASRMMLILFSGTTVFAFCSSSTLPLYISLKGTTLTPVSTAKTPISRSFRMISLLSVISAVLLLLPSVIFAAFPNHPELVSRSIHIPLLYLLSFIMCSVLSFCSTGCPTVL